MPKRAQGMDNDRILNLIKQWNQEHLDLFTLSPINESGEFHGVIRFYFQDDGAKVSTKCIRVSSTANVREVIDVLVEKFRPDMRMLTPSSYSLYEVHVDGDEKKLDEVQKPLLLQLEWGSEGREGRFLLKKDTDSRPMAPSVVDPDQNPQFKRKLSKREKKEQKKKEKEKLHNKENEMASLATKHYNELPETSFTRSISNPEAVMKRQRQQKLEKKLAEIHAHEGPHSAGTLKIYGEQLSPHVPYKTLLLSASDTSVHVLKETMAKYGLQKEDPADFYLLQILIPHGTDYHGGQMGKEFALRDDECPLAIAMRHSPSDGTLVFAIRRKSVEQKMKAKTMRAVSHEDLRYGADDTGDKHSGSNKLPFLVELYPDGSQNLNAKRHRLPYDTTDIGSDPKVMREQCIIIPDGSVEDRHGVITHNQMTGAVTIAPTNKLGEVYVNNARINDVTPISDGMVVGIGRHHLFRFRNMKQQKNQTLDTKNRNRSYSGGTLPREMSQQNIHETTFDVDGNVETNQEHGQVAPPYMHPDSRIPSYVPDTSPNVTDALPIAMEFREDAEDTFLACLIRDVNDGNLQFKLAPTYSLYMAVRYRLSTMYHPDMPAVDRARKVTSLVNKIAAVIQQTIQSQHENPSAMSFWMANTSELLHFFKCDHDIHPFSKDAQEILAECVQISFHHLVHCLQYDFKLVMMAFIDPYDDVEKEDSGGFQDMQSKRKPYINDVLNTLSSAMHLLRRCRVNAALTIQLFSQLFHFINMWLFNMLVGQPQLQLCTHAWGVKLKRRLRRIEAWAEEQGLELAADCHLCRIIQAAHLLQTPKHSSEDIDSICSTCFKLNSVQLRVLLENYIPEPNEPPIPNSLIAKVVNVASNMADAMLREDGREIHLEEDSDLQLPFLLPEDGYSAEAVSGVPNGLTDFLDPLVRNGLCRVFIQPAAQRDWTVYMGPDDDLRITELLRKGAQSQEMNQSGSNMPNKMEVLRVTFSKVNNSMGLSIVAAKGDSEKESGIYIKSVVPQGAADKDGRLKAGDQLIEVDGHNLIGISQESAADLMKRTGHTVSLKVGKQGAIFHGLAKLLSQPSPIMQRAEPSSQEPYAPQRNSEEAPPPYKAEPSPYLGRHVPYNKQYSHDSGPASASPRTLSPSISPGHRSSPRITGRDKLPPSTLQQARSSPALNTSRDDLPSERIHGGSTQNIPSTAIYTRQGAHSAIKHQNYGDDRSRSTSNLQHDTVDQISPSGRSASSSGLRQQPHKQPYSPRQHQPLSQSQKDVNRPDVILREPPEVVYREPQKSSEKHRDYENQQQQVTSPLPPKSETLARLQSSSGWTPPKPVPPVPFSAVDRLRVKQPASPASSQRSDTRPKSSYEPQKRDKFNQARPKSDEIDTSKVREWQEKNNLVDTYASRQYSPDGHRSEQYPIDDGLFHHNEPSFRSNEHSFRGKDPQFQHNDLQMKPNDPHFRMKEHQYQPTQPQYPVNEPRIFPEEAKRKSDPQSIQNEQLKNEAKYPMDKMNYRSPNFPPPAPTNFYENMTPGARDDPQLPTSSPNYANQEILDEREIQDQRSLQSVGISTPDQHSYVVKDNKNLQDLHNRFPPNSSLDSMIDRNNHVSQEDAMQQGYYLGPPQLSYPPPPPPPPPLQEPNPPVYYNEPIAISYGSRSKGPQQEEDAPPLPPPPQEPYTRTSLTLEERINAEQERMLKAIGPYSSKKLTQDPHATQQANRDSQRFSANYQPEQPQFVIQDQQQNTYVNTQQPAAPHVNDSAHNYQNIGKLPSLEQASRHEPRGRPSLMADSQFPKQKLDKTRPPPPTKPKPKPIASVKPPEPVVQVTPQVQQPNRPKQSDRLLMINQEISELEAISRLTPQQETRLQNLRLEQEFQRRLEESENREDEDSDDEKAERRLNREMLHQALQEDIEKTKVHLLELHRQQRFREFEVEKEHMDRLHQRLKVYEEDQVLQRERQARRQELKRQSQEEQQRKQREQNEKQRREFEENKKRLMEEEEKMRQRQEAEASQRREWEQQRLREMQAARDAEEDALRKEARRQQEEANARKLEEENLQRRLQDRRVTVQTEINRLDTSDAPLPPPPLLETQYQRQRSYPSSYPTRSYETNQPPPVYQNQPSPYSDPSHQDLPQFQHQYDTSHVAYQDQSGLQKSNYQPQQYPYQQQSRYNQPYRNQRPPSPTTPSGPQTNGPQITYPEPYAYNREQQSHRSDDAKDFSGTGLPAPPPPERTSSYEYTSRQRSSAHEATMSDFKHVSVPSSRSMQDITTTPKKSVSFNTQLETRNTYSMGTDDRSSTESSQRLSSSDSPIANARYSYSDADNSDVFLASSPQASNIRYMTADTPTVIGAQEIYRDPRGRIEAQRPSVRKPGPEKMSFKDKMKYFAAEAGESTPKERPKSSRSQRDIESQISNCQ